MTRYVKYWLFALIVGNLLAGCVQTKSTPETITIRQQTPGQLERFTQFELDIAYRKQAREDALALLEPEKGFSFCCVVFHRDIIMLDKVLTHFKEHVSADEIDGYGIHVLEHEDEYFVHLWERYREETQYQIEGFWYPGISENRLREYGYLIDRNTLEILEFSELPR